MSTTGGVTAIDFDLAVDAPRVVGCTRYDGGWADLLLETPIPLSDADARIVFESCLPNTVPGAKTLLMPLVRDVDGEIFAYDSATAPHLEGPHEEGKIPNLWQRLSTPCFYAGEAGAPSQSVYESVGDRTADLFPTAPLEFLGFRLLVRRNPGAGGARVSGRICLGDFAPAPFRFEAEEAPFAYADAFAVGRPAGRYTLGVQVRDAFQGMPVREFAETIEWDPDDPVSRHRRIAVPLGAGGSRWIDWRLLDETGAPVAQGFWRREAPEALAGRDVSAKRPQGGRAVGASLPEPKPENAFATFPPPSPDSPPPFGCLRINPVHPGRGVFEPGETPEIEVRVFGAPDGAEVAWRLMPCALSDILAEGSVPVPPPEAGCAYSRVLLAPPLADGRSAGRLAISVRDGGRVLDEREYLFGIRSSPDERHDRAGDIPDRRETKNAPYHRTTFSPRPETRATEAALLADYAAFLRESKPMATSFTFTPDLRDFEVLPGVFDTWLLDAMLDRAADAGMRVTIRLCHADLDGKNLYRWNPSPRQIAADGRVAEGRPYYGAYSVTDPGTLATWLSAYRALYDRYQDHTAFEGWYVMEPGGEWTVVDRPWEGVVSGYDPSTAEEFRDWLAKQYGDVAALDAAWGAAFGSFAEIAPPFPDWRRGATPDTRPEWIDFCRFKSSLRAWWMRKAAECIRAMDGNRLVLAFGSPRDFAKECGDMIDYAHNGGNHEGGSFGAYVAPWLDHGIGWITEPHHPFCWAAYGDPGDKGWCLDWSVWVGTAQAGGGGANYHVYFRPPKDENRISAYGGLSAFDRMEALRPVLAELHDMELLPVRAGAAFVSDTMTLWTKHRTTFSSRLADMRRWCELATDDAVPLDDFREEEDYALLLPNPIDTVMEAATFTQIVARVKAGAKAIVCADTGSLVPQLAADEPFQLLRALGIDPPAAPMRHDGTNVVATVLAGCPVFEEGRQIAFMTTDRLRAQLRDPEVQKNIQRYRYRWLPEADYFGWHPGVEPGSGKVLARFPDGGAALSLHECGAGEVLVFWGTPDIGGGNLAGMVKAAAETWAGIANPLAKGGVSHWLEGRIKTLGRHYLLVYEERPGRHSLPVPNLPDGTYFLDDAASGQRLGLVDGAAARADGVAVEWHEGFSPLKFLRFVPVGKATGWFGKYGDVPTGEKAE